jgi:hypothetical protein
MFGPGVIVANPAADIEALREQLDAAGRDAQALAAEMSEEEGRWRPRPEAWSVSECLDHLATGNRVYLRAMQPSADRARARGALRRRPAHPGWVGGMFARSLEPPPRWWSTLKAPHRIRPRQAPALADTYDAFMISHAGVRAFLMANADLDLAGIRFPNPFIRGIFFSLATGLHVLAAHERRHLWQAWQVRRAFERSTSAPNV